LNGVYLLANRQRRNAPCATGQESGDYFN